MQKKLTNQLIIMTDEHTRKVLRCYGNTIVKTPNLDQLAKRGTVFSNAYCNVPICVPSRASFATGQYAHTSGHWDNATPYTGKPESWGHALQRSGIQVGSIGKLHYRNSEDAVGFDFQTLPMHVVNGVGDVLGCVREPLPRRWKALSMAEDIGPGETNYNIYDRQVASEAVKWIKGHATSTKPWTLFVSLVAPHFPLIAPMEFYGLYENMKLMPSKPKPKPVVKKSEPKPQLKPKPPAETTVAAKSPPAPRPKRKPKPPPDEFQSLLKNLAKEKKQRKAEPEKKPEKIARKSPPTPKRSALQERMIAQGLVQAINSQVTPCWKIQAGAKDAANIRVAVNIRLNPDGSLGRQPRVQDAARMREGVDDFFRAVAESALRALRDPACMPLKLPYEHYDIWKEISFVFDPREALGQ